MSKKIVQRICKVSSPFSFLLLLALPFATNAQVPGSFDTSFAVGQGRITSLSIGAGNDEANAIAIQADGKIVLAGACTNGDRKNFCLARLNADGGLDTSFVGPGGNGGGKFMLPIGNGDDIARAVAIQPLDQKIVIVGSCVNGAVTNLCVARLGTNGALDTGFVGPAANGAGRFMFSIGSRDNEARAVALQADGKIVIAGSCANASTPSGIDLVMNLPSDFCMARLNTDGNFDADFSGPSGSAAGRFMEPIGTLSDVANAIAIRPDGKIALAGHCSTNTGFDFCAARFNANGSLDNTFDGPGAGGTGLGAGNGKFLLPIGGSNDVANALAIQTDGKIVLAGHCTSASIGEEFCIARLHENGSYDTGFVGPNGNAGGRFLFRVGSTFDYAFSVATRSGGQLTIAGYCRGTSGFDVCLARLDESGGFDAAFDGPHATPGDGRFLAPLGATAHFSTALALQSNGKIVVAGTCVVATAEFCIARFNSDGGGPPGTTCPVAHVASDVVQPAWLANIDLPATATRRTSNVIEPYFFSQATRCNRADIRNHLNTQCGMNSL
jgi:uncharacterized delta-60 repeat protein